MLTICQHHQPIDQACPACRRNAHAWTHAVTCYPWEVDATEHDDWTEFDDMQAAADQYGFDINCPPAIGADDIGDWIAERYWDGLVADYAAMPDVSRDPRGDAMHDIERDAELIARYVQMIREESD